MYTTNDERIDKAKSGIKEACENLLALINDDDFNNEYREEYCDKMKDALVKAIQLNALMCGS
jgi:uncharacterized protein YaaQ